MDELHMKFFIWVYVWVTILVVLDASSWCPQHMTQKTPQTFEKRSERFWEFDRKSNSWVEVDLPFDLVSCVNENCTKVASINQTPKKKETVTAEGSDVVQAVRKRVSLTQMSETSIWVTGESGCIYERFWNGVQWVIAPHDLPMSAGPAVSVFLINQTILALSEAGNLYQLHLNEITQLVWVEFTMTYEPSTNNNETDSRSPFRIKTGVVSYNGERAYFSTTNGSLVELSEIASQKWIYHGNPPGGDVITIVDVGSIKPDVVFTVSSTGTLYEFDISSKPLWKRHVQSKGSTKETLIAPSRGCSLSNLAGTHSVSLFLLTKCGNLVERRLYQRKWKWIVHGGPKKHHLDSMMSVKQKELTDKIFSLFFTTTNGSVFEYRLQKHSGVAQDKQVKDLWVNHGHPLHAKAARLVPGLQIQLGRLWFSLDDGRLGELHLSGVGGEGSSPTQLINLRRKPTLKYEWSVLDAPETEGWNSEYCTEERGPSNCLTGMRDDGNGLSNTRTTRRKGGQVHESYLTPSSFHGSSPGKPREQNTSLKNGINSNFRMRVMQEGRSYFFISDNGSTFEYLYAENLWLWLRHEHSTMMKGLLGNYNGSLFAVDTYGNLLIRERTEHELTWINGTALRKGKQVVGGPPWDRVPGKTRKVTVDDALFFVTKNGRLAQFTVALRKFKWKDCEKPANTKIAYIVDQEEFRDNIVFVVGRNGKLYQYNKVTEIWHEHLQSPHLILSLMPGTAMRQSPGSLAGSIFMVGEDGGLVEYQWRNLDGWSWIEHGIPYKGITFVGGPGPCLEFDQLFLIGSDGEVYLRYMDQMAWKWKSYGFPSVEGNSEGSFGIDAEYVNHYTRYCNPKVASVRPIPFSDDSVIFELRDGRLAELRRIDDTEWQWSRIIGTPTSLCLPLHWTTSLL
ncbi:hypothetical protein ACHQM5_012655 [Ranunculus cassubicifolius]